MKAGLSGLKLGGPALSAEPLCLFQLDQKDWGVGWRKAASLGLSGFTGTHATAPHQEQGCLTLCRVTVSVSAKPESSRAAALELVYSELWHPILLSLELRQCLPPCAQPWAAGGARHRLNSEGPNAFSSRTQILPMPITDRIKASPGSRGKHHSHQVLLGCGAHAA